MHFFSNKSLFRSIMHESSQGNCLGSLASLYENQRMKDLKSSLIDLLPSTYSLPEKEELAATGPPRTQGSRMVKEQ